MPELPEVQTVVDTLAPRVVGRRIVSVRRGQHDVVTPRGFDLAGAVVGQTILRVTRRAKRIVVGLDDGEAFFVHLGMTGRLGIFAPDAPIVSHTHVVFGLEDGVEVRFVDPRRFGGIVFLCEAASGGRFTAPVGPEPLTLRPAGLLKRLRATRRPVKNALLDQSLIAGLGNIYVDESLHAARIHPLTPAAALAEPDVRRLSRAIKRTLRRAIRHRGSTLRDYVDAEGVGGGFQLLHQVYARAGKPCRACGGAIERVVLGGRSTHFCPRCQPARTG